MPLSSMAIDVMTLSGNPEFVILYVAKEESSNLTSPLPVPIHFVPVSSIDMALIMFEGKSEFKVVNTFQVELCE
jgi:hypothetical protein